MSGKIAIRDAFGEALKELGAVNDKVVALEADVGGSTKSILFGKAYPERYFNVGISELNMVNMAVGLALEGYLPFALNEHRGPVYLRLSRAPADTVYPEDYPFVIGKGAVLREGKDVTIITTGTVLSRALNAAELLAAEGIQATVVDMHTVKPIDRELILDCARKTKAILTVEEHSVCGGLGSAVAEVLAGECPLSILGADEFAESGDLDALMDKYGYSPANIAGRAREIMKRKG